ncbi:MAG: hypothetical protein ISR58_12500 [Anaerolineales bacterium]|nr:hypothetical protein [Chloroflexota bacterium]MBL6981999.1 hypothetical protein [Anaerolineales bacterium]
MFGINKNIQIVPRQRLALLLLLLFTLILTGCGMMEAEITFYNGEKWRYEAWLAVPADLITAEGGQEAVDSYMTDVQNEIWREAPDVQIDLARESISQEQVVYRLTIDGEGWDKLTDVSDISVTETSEGIQIRYPLSYISDFEITAITVKGSKIISSNADVTTNGSATWHNPNPYDEPIKAVLVPKREISWIPMVFVVLVLGTGILMVRSLQRI